MAAALALLVLPLLVMFGLSALGVAVANADTNTQMAGLLLVAFILWVLLAGVVVLLIISRMTRRTHS